jgi:ferrous iron transport protein A
MYKRLSELKEGQSGIISTLDEDDFFLKLMEMGFIPGEIVTIEQIAPLGDPVSVAIAGYKVSLRLNEAARIQVELIPN